MYKYMYCTVEKQVGIKGEKKKVWGINNDTYVTVEIEKEVHTRTDELPRG